MATHTPIIQRLLEHGAERPDELAYRFLGDGDNVTGTYTFAELSERVRALAAYLQANGAADERVLLLFAPDLDYVVGFFACMFSGAIAVPAYPPDPMRMDRTLPRLESIVRDSGATWALTSPMLSAMAQSLIPETSVLHQLRWCSTDITESSDASAWKMPDTKQSIAFLQYTSGSTGDPKGVKVTHSSLLANLDTITKGFRLPADMVLGGWLPPYHDMGLIGFLLNSAYTGRPFTFMSPVAFLQRPTRWLEMISEYRVTESGGPNFAYDLCARKTTDAEKESLDLSCWRTAVNGAEPIRAATIDSFTAAFAGCGFRRETFAPCYGLAESTLMVTCNDSSRSPVFKAVQARALDHNLVAEPRIHFQLAARGVFDNLEFEGQTVDLSKSGTLLRSGTQVPRSSILSLYLDLPELLNAPVQAEVVRHTGPLQSGDTRIESGMGLRFLFSDQEIKQRLAAAIDRLIATAAPRGNRAAQIMVGAGTPAPGQTVIVVNPETQRRCWPSEVGEIWVGGESVADGYWGKPDVSTAVFKAHTTDQGDGPYLRTGDLGFLADGELFITGRLKDLVVIRGNNHYPQDIESSVQLSAEMYFRPGCTAAFAITEEGGERLVVIQELDRRYEPDRRSPEAPAAAQSNRRSGADRRHGPPEDEAFRPPEQASAPPQPHEILELVRQQIAVDHEIQPHAIVLIRAGTLPKTSSGKVQRRACAAAYRAGTLDVLHEWKAKQTILTYVAPRNELEKNLATLVAKILDIDRVSIDASFFDLGADSGQIVLLRQRIEDVLGLKLAVTDLFRHPTIHQLAKGATGESKGGAEDQKPSIRGRARRDTMKLMAMQGSMRAPRRTGSGSGDD